MRHTGGARAGRWAGVQAVCVSLPASQRGGGGGGVIKRRLTSRPQGRSLSALGPSGFYHTCLDLSLHRACRPRSISCLGKGDGGGRCCGQPSPSLQETGQQQQNLDRKLARVNGSLAEERHRGSSGSQDRGRRKDTDEPPFPVRPSGVI